MTFTWKSSRPSDKRLFLLTLLLLFCSLHANGANDANKPNLSMFDTSAPGISTNVQERVCVVDNSTDPGINATAIQSDVMGWLQESDGWETIGASKIDFVADCSDPNVKIEFHDIASPTYQCGSPTSPALACAPFLEGTKVSVYGHPRAPVTVMKIGAQYWTCTGVPSTHCISDKQRVIIHEMGHMVGLDHDGPVVGITSTIGAVSINRPETLYEKAVEEGPVLNEVYQARAQLNGLASPALHTCVGFPSNSQVLVSWFDTARDRDTGGGIISSDNSNLAALFEYDGSWQTFGEATIGALPNVGLRANFLFNVGSVGSNFWTARADVIGGSRNEPNWDPALFSSYAKLSTSTPNTPCTFALTATGGGAISLSWKDGSNNETDWHIYYALTDQYGALGSWQYRGTCAGVNLEGCGDSASWTSIFSVGQRLCARIAAGNSNGLSGYSNIACARVL